MRVAAYQAPYLTFGSFEAVGLIVKQVASCERQAVEVLCCPEAVLGGLAHESDGQSPEDVAIGVDNGEVHEVLRPLMDTAMTVIVGFTERDTGGDIFNSAAVVTSGELVGVYRKVFPGYRTVVQAGVELPVFHHGLLGYGVMICNDIWYPEPARVLAARGAAVVFVPTNSGHLGSPAAADGLRARGENLPVARAVENSTTVVVADIAGRQGERFALGSTRIVGPDGTVLAAAPPDRECLLIADVQVDPGPRGPRGWDGYTNPAVTRAFLRLWNPSGKGLPLPADDVGDLSALDVVDEAGDGLERHEIRLRGEELDVLPEGGGVVVDGQEPEIGAGEGP